MIRARALAWLGLLACVACRGPVGTPLAANDPRAGALLPAWSARVESRHALRAQAWLAVDPQGLRGETPRLRARQTLVLERPGRLRIEVQGMFGAALAVLAIDAGEYALFETSSRHFEGGPLPANLLRRVTGLALQPEEVVDVVLGAPRLEPPLALRAAFALPDGSIRVELDDAKGLPRVLLFDAEARLRELSVREPDDSRWTARFDDYADVAGDQLAHRITIESSSARAVLKLAEIELNPTLAADIFRLDDLVQGSAAEGG